MRRLLLALLFVPLLVKPAGERLAPANDPGPPSGFPLPSDRATPRALRGSALLLPLDTDAESFTITSPEQGVRFDIDGDGSSEMVAWPAAGANVAFLARDANHDGRITSGKELFGGATVPGKRNGPAALLEVFRLSGSPLSGSVHHGHELYEQLLLWTDRNHDGRSDRSEITPVRERFTAVGMGYRPVGWADSHGNRIRFEGWMQARTAGPLQGEAADALDQRRRRRRYFEVALQTAPTLIAR